MRKRETGESIYPDPGSRFTNSEGNTYDLLPHLGR
jgi:hypothetical protein